MSGILSTAAAKAAQGLWHGAGRAHGRHNVLSQLGGESAAAGRTPDAAKAAHDQRVREHFDQFVGETFYGQMLKSMRQTTGKQRYCFGGRAEKVFTQQFDQVVAEKMSHASGGKFSDSMFALYNLQRK